MMQLLGIFILLLHTWNCLANHAYSYTNFVLNVTISTVDATNSFDKNICCSSEKACSTASLRKFLATMLHAFSL